MGTTRGWRKWSVIILLLLPTLTGITLVNLIPRFYNFRLSFTNADRLSHNGHDAAHAFQDIGLQNYQTLIAELVTPEAVTSFAKLIITLAPLVVASIVAKRMTRNKLVPPDMRMICSLTRRAMDCSRCSLEFVIEGFLVSPGEMVFNSSR